MGLRHKSIRLRVLLLVLIPVLSLIGVYTYAATVTVSAALSLSRAKTVKNVTALPTGVLQQQLDAERRLALLYLASPTPQTLAQLNRQEKVTDRSLAAFHHTDMSPTVTADASAQEKTAAEQLVTAAAALPRLRGRIASGNISRPAALGQYTTIVTAGYRVLQAAAEEYSNVPLVMSSVNLIRLDEAFQVVLEESDLLGGDLAAGSIPAADQAEFTGLVATRRSLLSDTLSQMSPTYRAIYDKYVSQQSTAALIQMENNVIRSPAARNLPAVQLFPWEATVRAYAAGTETALTKSADLVTSRAQAQARTIYLQLILAGGLGLLAIILSLIFSVLIGRGLIRQLARLRESALELANDRLPSVMRRLRDGETVDVATEAPLVESSADEIDQVHQAFNIAARTAIEAAVDEASLRRGVSDVFRNLARRSQVLLHRQLRLLDGMERRATEPDELEDLFRIDHLTTRMRRHAEGLIILSGESPGRGWRQPVPLVDVLRGAVAEVEDYTRIRVEVRTRAALAGAAVADVIHLIAELAENATVFSPPNTPVRIFGDIVGRGFAIEIEDRGLGIADDRLAEINSNLSAPPAFDLSGSDRLGLFIAGRLARRHDIKITLRPSPYGGIAAIVVIPLSLVVDDDSRAHLPSIATNGRGASLAGRHAAALAEGRGPGAAGGLGRSEGLDLPGGSEGLDVPGGSEGLDVPGTSGGPDGPARSDGLSELAGPGALSELAGPDAREGWPADTGGGGADDLDSRIAAADLPPRPSLPVRVRQASLAPQLRDAPPPTSDARSPSGELPARSGDLPVRSGDLPVRSARQASPEAARTTMAALQRGWELGRSDAGPPSPTGDAGPTGEGALDGAGS